MKTTTPLAILLLFLLTLNLNAQEDAGSLLVVKPTTPFWGKKIATCYLNDIEVGQLPSKTKLRLKLKPGFYRVRTTAPFLSNEVEVEVKTGQTTFLLPSTTPNLSAPNDKNTDWNVVSREVGRSYAKRFTDATYTVEGAGSYETFTPTTERMIAKEAPAPPSATPSTETASAGEEKSEEELKKAAVDDFLSEAAQLNMKEVIANNARQKEMESIADLYDFTNVADGGTATKASTYSVMQLEEPPKLEKEFPNLKYRRSSVYTLMINDTSRAGYGYILSAFGDHRLPQKFNNHNVGPYLIEGKGGSRDEQAQINTIKEFVNENQLAKKLVAKWFNRSVNGGFNMDLISKRGYYNASDLDVALAQSSQRGIALLADAGEELINNTFILVSDYHFTNKEEVAKKVNAGLGFVAALAEASGEDKFAKDLNKVSKQIDYVGKGFVIKTRTYLFQLEWNEGIANQFYSQYWTTDENLDPARINAFNNSDIFKMKFVGYQAATADLQTTKSTKKSNAQLIQQATVRAQNKAIAKLERTYEQFRTKTPLFSTSPLTAKIGKKEGIRKNDKFEVLEQVLDKEGRTRYKRRAVITAIPSKIWDNTYGADEDPNNTQTITATHFKGNAKGLYEGMLIRQMN